MPDPYVYPGTDVLKNILGIRDRKKLDEAEAARGIPINRIIFEEHSTYVRTALVAYSAVFHDLGDLSKKEYLERIIRDSLGKC